MRGYHFCVALITAIAFSQLDSTLAIYCYNCTSTGSADGNCLMSPDTQATVECQTDCYTSISEGGTLTRGCLASGETCTGLSCSSCNTDKCNYNKVCQQCLGLAECATTNVTDTKYNAVCTNVDQVCVNQVNDNQTVSRQCGSACTAGTEANCLSCQTSLCNEGLFPANRQQCYTCSGTECNAVASTMISGCSLVDAKCFTTGTSATNLTRGCTSATAETTCTEDSTDPSCAFCESNLCNSLTYQRDAGSCVVCQNCPKQQSATEAKACDQALYNQTVGCYTETVGSSVNRGCINSLAEGCSTNNSCSSCLESACNLAAEDFKCIACISNEVIGCWSADSPADLPVVNCSTEKCFSGVWNGLMVRDCLSSASSLMQYQCDNKVEGYQCEVCEESSCNTAKYNGAASLSHMGVAGLLMALMGALRSAL